MQLIKGRLNSFQYAIKGLQWAYSRHPNYRIHLILSIVAICVGIFLQISYITWIFLIFTITLGFVIESINTAIEVTCDAIDSSFREDILLAKDVSAAAMLIYSIGAILIALCLFVPKILLLL